MAEFERIPGAGKTAGPRVAEIAPPRLPRITPAQANALNALYRPRQPLSLTLGGRALRLAHDEAAPPGAPAIAVGITIDDAPAVLHLCPASLAMLTAHLPLGDSLGGCSPGQRSLWLEYALLAWIEPLEAQLSATVQLLGDVPGLADDATVIALSLRRDDDTRLGRMVLSLSAGALHRVSPLLDTLGTPEARACATLPMLVQWIAGYQDIRLGDLRRLVPGDVVILERPVRSVAIAGHLMADVTDEDAGLRLLASLEGTRGGDLATPPPLWHDDNSHWEHRRCDDMAENTRKPAASAAPEAGLDDLPVRLVCELGRLELPLGELRGLGPGSILPLSRPTEAAVDLVVNGRPLGKGRLIEIGDSLGVQIIRLAGDE